MGAYKLGLEECLLAVLRWSWLNQLPRANHCHLLPTWCSVASSWYFEMTYEGSSYIMEIDKCYKSESPSPYLESWWVNISQNTTGWLPLHSASSLPGSIFFICSLDRVGFLQVGSFVHVVFVFIIPGVGPRVRYVAACGATTSKKSSLVLMPFHAHLFGSVPTCCPLWESGECGHTPASCATNGGWWAVRAAHVTFIEQQNKALYRRQRDSMESVDAITSYMASGKSLNRLCFSFLSSEIGSHPRNKGSELQYESKQPSTVVLLGT